MLTGSNLTSIKGYDLAAGDGTPIGPLTVLVRSKQMVVVRVPNSVQPPAHELPGDFRLNMAWSKGGSQTLTIAVHLCLGRGEAGTVGTTALDPTLRTDLDDAQTLAGRTFSHFEDASNLTAGTVDVGRFSAFDDLVAEGKIGAAATQVAPGTHDHDALYPRRADLSAAGTVNAPGNPVDWTQLKGVPASFADTVDNDTTYSAGTGLSLVGTTFSVALGGNGSASTVARSDHDHDTRYYTQSQLAPGGTINSSSNPVDWTRLKGVPAGLADGIDNDTDHTGTYLRLSGADTMTGKLYVTNGVVFEGSSGAIPATGSGARFMWYPAKRALRAGWSSGADWDDAAIGNSSMAFGNTVTASGDWSVAMGSSTTASGPSSFAVGGDSVASGAVSTALGYHCTASGTYYSTAMGYWSTSSGYCSTAIGDFAAASGTDATAFGYSTNASGTNSTAMGYTSTASGAYSTAMGSYTTAAAFGSLVAGRYNVVTGNATNWVSTDPLFVVGNGSGAGSPSNAFTLLKNGNLTIAGTLTQNSDARLKRDVTPLADVLTRLARVRGVSYEFTDQESRPAGRQIGVIAQELREAFPELVTEAPDGTLSVAYGNLTAVLVEAVKAQQKEIDARDREIAALRDAVERVRTETDARLARLEAALPRERTSTPAGDGNSSR
jgi:hypothetical protein